MERNYSAIKNLFLLENQVLEKIGEYPGYKYPLFEKGIINRLFNLLDSQKIECPKEYVYVRDIFTRAHTNIGRGKISAKTFIQLLRSLLTMSPRPIEIPLKDKRMLKRVIQRIVKLGSVMTGYEQEEDYEGIKVGFQEFPEDVIIDLCKFRNEHDFKENIKCSSRECFAITHKVRNLKKEMGRSNNLEPKFIRDMHSKQIKYLQEKRKSLRVSLRLKKLLWQLKKDYYESTLSWRTGASSWCPHCGANGTGCLLILRPANPLRPSISIGDARRKYGYHCNHGKD